MYTIHLYAGPRSWTKSPTAGGWMGSAAGPAAAVITGQNFPAMLNPPQLSPTNRNTIQRPCVRQFDISFLLVLHVAGPDVSSDVHTPMCKRRHFQQPGCNAAAPYVVFIIISCTGAFAALQATAVMSEEKGSEEENCPACRGCVMAKKKIKNRPDCSVSVSGGAAISAVAVPGKHQTYRCLPRLVCLPKITLLAKLHLRYFQTGKIWDTCGTALKVSGGFHYTSLLYS